MRRDVCAQVELVYKFPDKGRSQIVRQDQTSIVFELNRKTFTSSSDQSMTIDRTNGDRASDGTIKTTYKIAAIRASLKLPTGKEITFDSKSGDTPPNTDLHNGFKALLDSSWTVERDKSNRITAIDRAETTPGSEDTLPMSVKRQLSAANLSDQAISDYARIPNKAVSNGEEWPLQEIIHLEAGQRITVNKKCIYAGTIDRSGKQLDRIVIQADGMKATYTAQDSPLEVINTDALQILECTGEVLFDRNVGEIISSQQTTKLKGTVTLQIDDTKLAPTLTITLNRSSQRR